MLLACAVLGSCRAQTHRRSFSIWWHPIRRTVLQGQRRRGASRLGLHRKAFRSVGPELIYRGIGLSRVARPTITRSLPGSSSPSRSADRRFHSEVSGRLAATSMAVVSSVASAGLASLTQLNLGDGTHLSVSDSVGAALADALSSVASSSPVLTQPVLTPPDVLTAIGGPRRSDDASRPDTLTVANASNESNNADVSGNNHDGHSGPSSDYNPVNPLPGTTADGFADESVRAILTEISSGIISQAANKPIARPATSGPPQTLSRIEPATLILLASALVLTANRLRRPRHCRAEPRASAHQSRRSARGSEPRYVVVHPGEIATSKTSGS